jgi:hypothetical protein
MPRGTLRFFLPHICVCVGWVSFLVSVLGWLAGWVGNFVTTPSPFAVVAIVAVVGAATTAARPSSVGTLVTTPVIVVILTMVICQCLANTYTCTKQAGLLSPPLTLCPPRCGVCVALRGVGAAAASAGAGAGA